MENFKNCLPDHIVVHINDQMVTTLNAVAVLGNEFVLTLKSVFSPASDSKDSPHFQSVPVTQERLCT